MLKPRIGCYAVYEPPEEGWQDWAAQLAGIREDLTGQGLEVVQALEAVCDEASCVRVADWFTQHKVDLLHALIITWSLDHYTVRIQRENPSPVAVRAIPGIRTGSIVGSQQLGCILSDLEMEHRLFYAPIGDAVVAAETAVYARACALRNDLRGTRFAMVGIRTPGMTPAAVDEVELLRLLGVVLMQFDYDHFAERADKVAQPEAEAIWKKVAGAACDVRSSREDGIAAARNYLALKSIAQEWNLRGIAVGSYPKCQGTVCLPLALLNDEGIAAGCEGDLNATLAMYILERLTGRPAHFGEMLDVDELDNAIVTSHCGAGPPSLADTGGYVLCPVRLAYTGVCIRYTTRPGPVTYMNLVGRKDNYRMYALLADAEPTGMVFEGNPMRMRLRSPFRKIWREVSTHGFGHHWMAGCGHIAKELAEFCRLTGIRGVFPDECDAA